MDSQWLNFTFTDGKYYKDTSFPISFGTVYHVYITDAIIGTCTSANETFLGWNIEPSSTSNFRGLCAKNIASRVEAFAIGRY